MRLDVIYNTVEKWCQGIGVPYVNTFNEDIDDLLQLTSHVEMEFQEQTTTEQCGESWILTVELHFKQDGGGGVGPIHKMDKAIDQFKKNYLADTQSKLHIVKLDGIDDMTGEGRLHLIYSFTATFML